MVAWNSHRPTSDRSPAHFGPLTRRLATTAADNVEHHALKRVCRVRGTTLDLNVGTGHCGQRAGEPGFVPAPQLAAKCPDPERWRADPRSEVAVAQSRRRGGEFGKRAKPRGERTGDQDRSDLIGFGPAQLLQGDSHAALDRSIGNIETLHLGASTEVLAHDLTTDRCATLDAAHQRAG